MNSSKCGRIETRGLPHPWLSTLDQVPQGVLHSLLMIHPRPENIPSLTAPNFVDVPKIRGQIGSSCMLYCQIFMFSFSFIFMLKPNRTVKSWFKGLSVPGQVFSYPPASGFCLCLSYSCQNCVSQFLTVMSFKCTFIIRSYYTRMVLKHTICY
mgnify:CR=1 FL=1